MKRQALVYLLLLLITACAPGAESEPVTATLPSASPTSAVATMAPAPPTQEPEKDATQMTQPARTPPASNLDRLIEKAREDLAQRLSLDLSQIALVEATAVVWADASLGCPQPGMVYAQVLTPGYLILLQANNRSYEYHASRGTELIYCANPEPPVAGTPDDV